MKHSELLKSVVTYLKKEGCKEVHADLNGYSRPAAIRKEIGRSKIYPDVHGLSNKNEYIVSVERKFSKKEMQERMVRWIMMNAEAKRRKINFFVAVPTSESDRFKNFLATKGLEIDLHEVSS